MTRSKDNLLLCDAVRATAALCSLSALIVAIHRGFESVGGDRFDRARGAIEQRCERLPFGGGHRAQQIVFVFLGLRLAARLHLDLAGKSGRPADTHSDANEIRRTERLRDRAHAAIAGVAAALLDPETARFEIELVVQHDQTIGVNFEISEDCRNAFTAQVVESLRLDQQRRLLCQSDFSGYALESAPARLDAFRFGDSIDCHEAGVVTRARVFFAGISEAGHDPLNR